MLNFDIRWMWVVSFMLRSLYTPGETSWYPSDERLGGSQSRSGRGGEEKTSHHCSAGNRIPVVRNYFSKRIIIIIIIIILLLLLPFPNHFLSCHFVPQIFCMDFFSTSPHRTLSAQTTVTTINGADIVFRYKDRPFTTSSFLDPNILLLLWHAFKSCSFLKLSGYFQYVTQND
jgi:hypothetical protein